MNVLALDLPGHGRTPGPGRASIAAYAAWLDHILKGLPVQTCFLGGHSMGGAVCLELALQRPGTFRGLILMAAAARFPIAPETLSGLLSEPNPVLERINRQCYARGTSPAILAQSLRLLRQTAAETIHGDFLACSRFQRVSDLGSLRCPTLILAGEQDRLLPPSMSALLQTSLPDSRLISIPDAGHMVMLEKPGLVNRAILDFIEAQG
jgi:pimeloyl-ACP methyl ester carboxylesterase